jgi:hypothetical protein
MHVREAAGSLARGYMRAARVLALILVLMTPLMVAYAQSSEPLTLTFSNIQVSTSAPIGGRGYNPGGTGISGTVTVHGSWSGGALQFGGWAVVYGYLSNPSNIYSVNITLTSGSFNPQSLDYPRQSSSIFSASHQGGFSHWTSYSLLVNAYDSSGNLVGTSGQQQGQGTAVGNPLYTLAVELPLFNDTMLGATVNQGSPVIDIGGIYNFMMAIAIILITVGAMVALFTEMSGKKGRNIAIEVAIGIILVLIFPLLYNEVATLVNYMTQAIIAYPSDYTTYGVAIQNVWNTASLGGVGGWLVAMTLGVAQLAIWLMQLIAWLMSYFLGTIRLFLIAAVLVGFPLAMAFRTLPFTGKLSQMLEDTLFGLILASIMSAVVLGVANGVIAHYSGTIFDSAGVQPAWIAIAAIFAVILMPTVFAPLTAIMMQTVSQTATAGGSAAAVIAGGVGLPGVGGIVAGGKAAMGAFGSSIASQTQALASSPLPTMGMQPSRWLAMKSGLGEFAGTFKRHAAMPILRNAAIVGSTGALTAAGGYQAAKILRGMLPPSATHIDVMQSHEAASSVATIRGHFDHMHELALSGANYDPGSLISPKTGRVFEPRQYDPADAKHWDTYYSPLRDYYSSAPSKVIAEELVKNKILPESTLNNPKAVDDIGREVRAKIAAVNPNSEQGARTIHNIKTFNDAEEFKVSEGLK